MLDKLRIFLNKNYERTKAKRSLTTEIAPLSASSQALGLFVGDIMLNPDIVLSSTHAEGKGFKLYQEMIDKDPQVASCVRSRKKAVLNKPWEIVPASDRRRDHLIADFVIWAFGYQRRRESWYEMMDVVPKGLAVLEIIWGKLDGKITVLDLKGRDPDRFVFDKDGNLRLKTTMSPWEGEKIPQDKFIYLRNEPFAENPYGNAALKEVFWYYWFKKNAIKWWSIFMEKFGSPTILGTYASGTLNTSQKSDFADVLAKLQNATSMLMPEGLDVNFLEALRRGDAGYPSFINYCDEQIARSIHGQTLTSSEGQRVGSLALGKVHQETKYEYTADDSELVMDGQNTQLIPLLVNYNFAGVKEYPRLVIHYEPEEDLMNEAKKDEIVFVKIGLPVGKKHLYEKYGVPEPEEDEELLEIPQKGGLPFSDRSKKKLFAQGRKGYRIASTAKLEAKYYKEIQRLIESLQDGYLGIIEGNQPLGTALEGLIKTKYNPQVADLLDKTQWESIVLGAQSMADQLKLTVNKDVFIELMDDWIKRHAYEMGTIEDMGTTLRELLEGKAQALFDQELTVNEVASQIKKEFPSMADWKAKQIAKTEISTAADFAGTQMVKRSGVPVEAWFLIDPESCDTCQEWATHSPYTLRQAEGMGLPHPNCNDQWTFTVKGKK